MGAVLFGGPKDPNLENYPHGIGCEWEIGGLMSLRPTVSCSEAGSFLVGASRTSAAGLQVVKNQHVLE